MYHDAVTKHKIDWLFNLEMWEPKGIPAGIEYVPQVRTAAEVPKIKELLAAVHNPKHFIGFNEPEMPAQANISPSQAAALWKQHVEPAHEQYKFSLGSPAISSSPKGKAWLEDFFKQIGGNDKVDFIVVHWYGTEATAFENFVKDIYGTFKKPIWVTEFAYSHLTTNPPASTVAQVEQFMKQAIDFLDRAPLVHRYAYFGAGTNVGKWVGEANNFSQNGHLTEIGKKYCTR